MRRYSVVIFPFAFMMFGATSGPVHAAQGFDGQWSVEVTPERGQCDGMYVLPVEVREGNVTYIGRGATRAEGGVSKDGTVRVSFISQEDRLDARGSMSNGRFGTGSWASPTEDCRGTWIARKR